MANIIALDWDTHELRAVVAKSSMAGISITEALTVNLTNDSADEVTAAIRQLLEQRGLAKSKTKTMVAIGRGKAELRQVNLPPVPENELPDMVRLQAMQTFAAVGENTLVDFITLPSPDESTAVLAAAVAPATMKSVESIIAASGLELVRVALRPVAAAALYQIAGAKNQSLDDSSIIGDVVLVDLLADDVEIVVMRGRRVMFVRSVRMPPESAERPAQIAGELRRSLMACGINASSSSQKVVIWGQAKTHESERLKMAESLGCRVSTLDPLTLVDSSASATGQSHTGRFAPLIGLLIADSKVAAGASSPYLVDFLNPRKSIEVKRDHRKAIAIGVSAAVAAVLAGYFSWSNLRAKDQQIDALQSELASLKPQVTLAQTSIDRTEVVDKFLDGNVIWIDELTRTSSKIPSSTDAILKSITAVSPPRDGGGKLTLAGAATTPVIVDQLASALRDGEHSVAGSGASDLGDKETYRWGFREMIEISPTVIRNQRYQALANLRDQETTPGEVESATTPVSSTSVETETAAGETE